MNVYQVRIKLYFLQDIAAKEITRKITAFIDQEMIQHKDLEQLHRSSGFKFYVYDNPYPIPRERIYRREQIYTLTLRTVDSKLADFFSQQLVHAYTDCVKGLSGEIKVIPKGIIEQIYSLTPVIIKLDSGRYWRDHIALSEYERLVRENLIKKWNLYHNIKMDEDFPFYTYMEFKNHQPIPFFYKEITLLGDKISLHVADDKIAQKLAYFSLGTGMGVMNARGAGYMHYKFY